MEEILICKFCKKWKVKEVDHSNLEKKIARSQLETHIEDNHPEEWQKYLDNGGRMTTF